MTPARLAEIRAYIERLDLNQLPGWTVEQRIIADLWETLGNLPALLKARADSYWRDARTLRDMNDEQAALIFETVADELRKIADQIMTGPP